MATLNLRISSSKSKSINVKSQKLDTNFPTHATLFYLQMKEDLRKKKYDNNKLCLEILGQYLNSKSVDDHLFLLKKIAQLSSAQQAECCTLVCSLVTTTYLVADSTSHLKNAALKVLELPSLKSIVLEEVVSQLACYLGGLRTPADPQGVTLESLAAQGLAAASLLHCTKSRVLGERVAKLAWWDLLAFLAVATRQNVEHLATVSGDSPTQQQSIFCGLHSLSQSAVTLLQLATKKPSLQEGDPSPPSAPDSERELARALALVLSCPPSQLPSDTQNTCAVALVLLSRRSALCAEEEAPCSPLLPAVLLGSVPPSSPWSPLSGCSPGVRVSLAAALLATLGDELALSVPADLAATLGVETDTCVLQALFYFLAANTGRCCEASLLLGGCRALATLGRALSSCCPLRPGLLGSLLPPALDHCLTHLEHHMDSVRHASKGLLDFLIAAANGLPEEGLVTEAVLRLPGDGKAKFAAASALGAHRGTASVLRDFPGLVGWLLDSTQTFATAPHAVGALEILMRCHVTPEVPAQEWCQVWVRPMLTLMPSATLEPALAKAVQLRPQTLTFVLEDCTSQDVEENSRDSTSKLKVMLSCLKMAQKCNMLKEEREGYWQGVLRWERLHFAMSHSEEEVRLAAIALLVESRKSTEPMGEQELQLIRVGMANCGDSHAPSTQHRASGLIKKLLCRLSDSVRGLVRRRESVSHYLQFLSLLCEDCFRCLFPGSSLGRRSLGLHTLALVLELLATSEPWSQVWREGCTRKHADAVLYCLGDSYESNKELAATVLAAFPASALGFDDPATVCDLIGWCLDLSQSCRPPDSLTAAYTLSLVVGRTECLSELQKAANCSHSSRLSACLLLLQRLESQLEVARGSLLQAAAKGPMYGTVLGLRHLLSAADLASLANTAEGPLWKGLVDRLVQICFDLTAVVAPIVNSSSPEGHLPMDFESDISSDLGSLGVEEVTTVKVTAQMLLLCSWRTVKEVSLMLGELAASAPASNGAGYVLDSQQLIAIGEHFTSMLCETKHRGAFEQAYVGFCRMCAWLWRVPSGELPQLPSRWLHELMVAILSEEDETCEPPRLAGKLCATRRSAGVPFIVQALVTTELEVRERPECFPVVMSQLLELAGHSGRTSQVHALNILRALFRSSQLGEHVALYVAEGFSVAIQAFKGASWAERNAATLLYSALMSRVFGVKHTPGHEELPRKNRMTGRIFFRLYPRVFELLASELREAATLIRGRDLGAQLTPSLHPVLLLLARLYPSSLEGTDTSLNLLSLRESVVSCAGSPVLHTRQLAARALVPLVDPLSVPAFVASLSLSLPQPHNTLHGTLLQLAGLARGSEPCTDLHLTLSSKLWEGLPLLAPLHTCNLTKTAFLELTCAVLERHPAAMNPELAAELTSRIANLIATPGCIGYSTLKQTSARVLLLLTPWPDLEPLLCSLLSHPLPEVALEALDFIVAQPDGGEDSGKVRGSETLAQQLLRLAVAWTPSEGQEVSVEARTSLFLTLSRLAAPALRSDWPVRSTLRSDWSMAEQGVAWLLQLESEGVLGLANHCLLACCGEMINAMTDQPSEQLIHLYASALLRSCDEESSLDSRLVAAQSLCLNHDRLLSSSPEVSCLTFCATMLLLQDASDQVRATAARPWPQLASLTRTRAAEQLTLTLATTLAKTDLQGVLATLLLWTFGDLLTCLPHPENDNLQDHERVFEKGDVAQSCEEWKMTQAAVPAIAFIVESYPREEISAALNKPLDWLPLAEAPPPACSLRSLLDQAVASVKMAPLHFLHPDHPRAALDTMRVESLQTTGLLAID